MAEAKPLDAAGAFCCWPNGEAPCEGFPNELNPELAGWLLVLPNGLEFWLLANPPLAAPKGFAAGALLLLPADPKGLALLFVFVGAPKGFGFWPSWLA